jgi:hypothetical protein
VNDLPAQFQVLARGDVDQWIDLLIIVVLGVFYAIAGVIRAARKKSQEAQRDRSGKGQVGPTETWQQWLVRKAEEIQRAVEAKSREAAERMQRLEQQARTRESTAKPRPRAGKVVARPGRGGESVLVYERNAPGDAARSHHAAREQRAREAISAAAREATMQPSYASLAGQPAEAPLGPVAPGELGGMAVTTAAGSSGYDPASIIDPGDPDALRKAILHYEILGKPIGLRDPFEHGASL